MIKTAHFPKSARKHIARVQNTPQASLTVIIEQCENHIHHVVVEVRFRDGFHNPLKSRVVNRASRNMV